MQSGSSRIYSFPDPDAPAYDPYRKLKIIIGIILLLYVVELGLMGTKSMINKFVDYLILIPVILISLSTHEFAHAWMADFLGDPTPRRMGRLSLDPRRHLDFWGTLLLFFSNFGWAKPVLVNPENFKVRDRAMMSVALAGPVVNLILAFFGALILKIIAVTVYPNSFGALMDSYAARGAVQFISTNLGLAFFNLIPLPPLDGSKVLTYFLTPKQRFQYQMVELMGPMILILLVSFGLVGMIIGPAIEFCFKLLFTLFFVYL